MTDPEPMRPSPTESINARRSRPRPSTDVRVYLWLRRYGRPVLAIAFLALVISDLVRRWQGHLGAADWFFLGFVAGVTAMAVGLLALTWWERTGHKVRR